MQKLSLEYIQEMQKSEEFIKDMEAYNKEFPYEPHFEDDSDVNAA